MVGGSLVGLPFRCQTGLDFVQSRLWNPLEHNQTLEGSFRRKTGSRNLDYLRISYLSIFDNYLL